MNSWEFALQASCLQFFRSCTVFVHVVQKSLRSTPKYQTLGFHIWEARQCDEPLVRGSTNIFINDRYVQPRYHNGNMDIQDEDLQSILIVLHIILDLRILSVQHYRILVLFRSIFWYINLHRNLKKVWVHIYSMCKCRRNLQQLWCIVVSKTYFHWQRNRACCCGILDYNQDVCIDIVVHL